MRALPPTFGNKILPKVIGSARAPHKLVPEQCSIGCRWLIAGTEEAMVLKSEEYRQYAKDCLRFAEKMSAAEKQTLSKIAEAWETRALEAEREEKRKG
jgi:hypothetical protein